MKTSVVLLLSLILIGLSSAQEQKMETLFGDGTAVRFVWSLDTRTIPVQQFTSTSIGATLGVMLNESMIAGASFGANLTHPEVNNGYAGILFQYFSDTEKLFHWGGYLLIGSGMVKDYEHPKTNPFDNFGNVFGTGYYFGEPGAMGEVNISAGTRLAAGIGYRLASGIDPANSTIALHRPVNADLSGVTWNLSLRFD